MDGIDDIAAGVPEDPNSTHADAHAPLSDEYKFYQKCDILAQEALTDHKTSLGERYTDAVDQLAEKIGETIDLFKNELAIPTVSEPDDSGPEREDYPHTYGER